MPPPPPPPPPPEELELTEAPDELEVPLDVEAVLALPLLTVLKRLSAVASWPDELELEDELLAELELLELDDELDDATLDDDVEPPPPPPRRPRMRGASSCANRSGAVAPVNRSVRSNPPLRTTAVFTETVWAVAGLP